MNHDIKSDGLFQYQEKGILAVSLKNLGCNSWAWSSKGGITAKVAEDGMFQKQFFNT